MYPYSFKLRNSNILLTSDISDWTWKNEIKKKGHFQKSSTRTHNTRTYIQTCMFTWRATLLGWQRPANDSLWGQQMIRSICTLLSSPFCPQSILFSGFLFFFFFLAPGSPCLPGPGPWCTLDSHIHGANTLLRRTLLSPCIFICIPHHARTQANHQLMTRFQEKM